MRKRIVAILMICILSAGLCACGDSLPDFTTQEAYDLGVEAYECMEDFCNGSMNADTLEEELSRIYDDLEKIEEDHEKNDTSLDYITDGSIALDVNLALAKLKTMDEGETYGVEEVMEDLVETLELD